MQPDPPLQPELLDSVPSADFFEAPPPALPSREPFWGYIDLLLILGLTVAALAIILLITAGLSAIFPLLISNPAPLVLPLQLAVYGALYLEFLFVFRIRYRQGVMRSLGWRRSSFNLTLAALAGGALAFVVSLIASLLHTPQVSSPMEKLLDSPATFIPIALLAITAAPFFEELLFRGFIQPLLSRTFGVIAGILITSAVFGALHGQEYSWAWQYMVAVAFAGAVFGWVRARTNSIIPGTVMHACYNAMFVVAVGVTKHIKH